MASLFFEDFVVGQRFDSPVRAVTQADLDAFLEVSGDRNPIHLSDPSGDPALLHAPFGLTVFLGLLHEMGLVEHSALAMLDAEMRFVAPIHVGDVLRFEMTITRRRRTSAGDRGVIGRHVRILNQHDTVVQEGSTALLVRCREPAGPDRDLAARDFGSRVWAEALRPILLANETFVSAVALYDGCIGLQAGKVSTQLRVYRGDVIEVASSTPLGPSFVVSGDEIAWVDLVSADRNDYMVRAMRDEFRVAGNQYEYLRLTKAVVELFDGVRELARLGVSS